MASASVYTLSKRHNSTLQPTGTGTVIDVYLKGGSDLLTPVFTINSATIPTFNYMTFEGRFYFVTGIRNVRDQLYEVSCQVDVLATYKGDIQAASAYVLYYSHNNTEITDQRLSTKTTQTTQSENASFDYFGVGFTHVLMVVGMDHVAAFKVNMSDIKAIVNQSFFSQLESEIGSVSAIDNSSPANAISDAGRFIKELITTAALSATYVGKLSDCIRNCYVLPIDPAAWTGNASQIFLGKCNTQKTGVELSETNRTLHDSATVTIPWQASDWRRNAPYHEIYLYIPCIGLTSISPSDVIDEIAIHVDLTIDLMSGDTIINVGTASKVLAQYTTNVAVNFAIGSNNIDPARAIMSIGNMAGSVVTGNPGNALSDALGLANVLQPQAMSIGGNGGGAFLGFVSYQGKKVYCFTVFHDTTVDPSSISAIKGTPYNGVLSLSGISGYVQTTDASVAGSMTDTEREEINNLLNGGVYIE